MILLTSLSIDDEAEPSLEDADDRRTTTKNTQNDRRCSLYTIIVKIYCDLANNNFKSCHVRQLELIKK